MGRTFNDKYNSDGTRRSDNAFQRLRDRANGDADRRLRERDKATFGRGDWSGNTGDRRTDNPSTNPWAPGGSFNPHGRKGRGD